MKQIGTFVFFCFFLSLKSNSQIAKGDWLLGGNISFSSIKLSSDLGERTEIFIQGSGNAGYFFCNKLAGGLRPGIDCDWYKTNTRSSWSTELSIGPFLRYYFLPDEQRINIFSEAGYAYGNGKVSNQKAVHSNTFSLLAGTVLFLNTSVGLELSIGYTIQKSNDNVNSQLNTTQIGIGLQYHLEKE